MAAVIEEKKVGLREFISTGYWVFGVFFLITLLTFNQDDGGWTHSGISSVPKNAGGMIGAWMADLVFSLFGFEAFLFPFIIVWQGYSFYKQEHIDKSQLEIIFRWLGLLITFVAGTVIFYLHVPRLVIDYPNGSGGILGQEVGDMLLLMLTENNTTLLSVTVFLVGLSFFIGFSWFNLIDKIGQFTLWLLVGSFRLAFTGQRTTLNESNAKNNTKRKSIEPIVKKKVPIDLR